MNPVDAAQRWARTWKDAWEALDVDAVVALYAADVVFSSQPFRPPYRGVAGVAEYVGQAFGSEEHPVVRMSEPIVQGDRASVSWWTALSEDGDEATLAGTSVMRFDTGGLVIEQWDTWNLLPERSDPPGWSFF